MEGRLNTMNITEQTLNQIDQNHMKARIILMNALAAHQNNDCEDYNTAVEAALDYLSRNEDLLKEAI